LHVASDGNIVYKKSEHQRAYAREYAKAYRKKYYHTEKFQRHMLEYRKTEGFRKSIGHSMMKYYYRLRLELFKLLGSKCSRCGIDDYRCLQIDHVNGGGKKESREKSRFKFLQYYTRHPEEAKQKLQLLCANCNWIKRHEDHESRKKSDVFSLYRPASKLSSKYWQKFKN
jgi:hypothetical protein